MGEIWGFHSCAGKDVVLLGSDPVSLERTQCLLYQRQSRPKEKNILNIIKKNSLPNLLAQMI
jgi:hypothetical protein